MRWGAGSLSARRSIYGNPEQPILGPIRLEITANRNLDGFLLAVKETGYGTGDPWDWYCQAVVVSWPQTLGELRSYLAERNSMDAPKAEWQ